MICRSRSEARSFESCWNFLLYLALHFLLITLQNTSLTASKIAVPWLSNITLVATEFWPRRSANKWIPNKLGTRNSNAIAFGNPFVRRVTQSEPLGCAIVLRRNSAWLHRSAMQLNCDRYRFRRSTHSFDWDSQYFSREEMISMPQLCAYIFAILFEFSGIF